MPEGADLRARSRPPLAEQVPAQRSKMALGPSLPARGPELDEQLEDVEDSMELPGTQESLVNTPHYTGDSPASTESLIDRTMKDIGFS